MLDEFVLNYTLERLEKMIEQNRSERIEYQDTNNTNLSLLTIRIGDLENKQDETDGTIQSLLDFVYQLRAELDITKDELIKTKLHNLKQEIIIRTLHNMQAYDGYDMFVDTFVDDEGIDWNLSLRVERFPSSQSIGRTVKSFIVVQQITCPDRILISGNDTSDAGVMQSFQLSEAMDFHRASVYIERHQASAWQDVHFRIKDGINGNVLTQTVISATKIGTGGWVDVDFPIVHLEAYKNYYLEILTDDTYGYRVGCNIQDVYVEGSSYRFYNDVWTENSGDLAFKIWCYPNPTTEAYVYTKVKTLDDIPTHIIFEKEDRLNSGTIIYYVSRDNGSNWKLLHPGIETNLNDLPEGYELVIRAVIRGDAHIDAWGYTVRKGDNS